jgi:hypothetical protein
MTRSAVQSLGMSGISFRRSRRADVRRTIYRAHLTREYTERRYRPHPFVQSVQNAAEENPDRRVGKRAGVPQLLEYLENG